MVRRHREGGVLHSQDSHPGACVMSAFARIARRVRVWRLRTRVAELRSATALAAELIRSDQMLIERQRAQLDALEKQLLELGELTT